MKSTDYTLLAPGPVPLLESVQKTLSEPMIHHRVPEFESILNSAFEKLKSTFCTKQPVLILQSSGTGAMEAAVLHSTKPGDKVLSLDAGKFGNRWSKIAAAYHLNVVSFEPGWGKKINLERFQQVIQENQDVTAVFLHSCETSTGTMYPIEEMARIIKKHSNALVVVDGITGVGTLPVRTDDWGLDIVIGGSQKSFMIPTGLSFITLSENAWEVAHATNHPRFYFNLSNELKAFERGQTQFSSSVTLIKALNVALDELSGNKLEERIQRSQLMAEATRAAVKTAGLDLFSEMPSNSVTAISVPNNIDGNTLRSKLESDHNVTIMGGQDHLKGKIVRFGHMGAISNEMLIHGLECFFTTLQGLGFSMNDNTIKDSIKIAKDILGE